MNDDPARHPAQHGNAKHYEGADVEHGVKAVLGLLIAHAHDFEQLPGVQEDAVHLHK